jgi:hypothetical protein
MAEQLGASETPPGSEGRACATCSTMNPASASFCWKCLATLPPANASVRPFPAPGAIPPPLGEPTNAAPSRRLRLPVAIIVGLVAAFLGHAIFGALFGTDLTMPESVAGLPRDHSAAAQRFEDEAENGFGQDVHAAAAAYGETEPPQFFIIAIADPSSAADQAFQSYANGFMSGSNGQTSVDVAGRSTGERDGATFICADVTGALAGTLCMWKADGVSGLFHAIRKERPEALAFTREARSLVGA